MGLLLDYATQVGLLLDYATQMALLLDYVTQVGLLLCYATQVGLLLDYEPCQLLTLPQLRLVDQAPHSSATEHSRMLWEVAK